MYAILRLVLILLRAVSIAPPSLPLATGLEHAYAAIAAERPTVPAELLLGMAAVESNYTATARSRGGRYCGVVQATAGHGPGTADRTCRELYDLRTGYDAGARHIVAWLRQCHRVPARRRLRCALRGYGGVSVNGSVSYPGRVLHQTDLIRRHARRRRDDVARW